MTTYKELDYLESTGTQYIDTLWHPQSNNLRVKFKVKSKGTPRSTSICGAENSNVVPRWVFVMFGQAADDTKTFPLIGDWKNGGSGFAAEGFTFTDGTTLEIDWTANATSTTVTDSVSGTTYTHTFGTTINYLNNTTTLKMFQNGDTQKAYIDMYYYQIYDNNVLVRDFIPVLDFNNTPCMYDKVTNTYYYNQGTGSFNYSVKGYYCEVEYLESTGTQYIDTGFIGNQNTRIHTKMKMSASEGQTTAVFGSRILAGGTVSGSFYAYCVYSATSPNYRIQYGFATQTYNDTANVDFTKPIDFDFDKRVVRVNGTAVKTFTAATFTNPSSILIFNCHTGTNGTDVDTRYNVSRLYFFQIYDNGTLVRDFIPVLDWNMTPCLYDKITGEKIYNQGTGQFLYGAKETKSNIQLRRKFNMLLASHKNPEYTPLKYLEGTGTGTYTSGQYIDTGLDYFADFEITAKQRESAGMKALGTTGYYCVERENATTNAWRFRNGESTFFTTSLLVTDLHTLKWKNGKVYGDGVELGSFAKTTGTKRMYLFGSVTTSGTPRINRYPLQISSCRMWNPSTGELVRDYIPVLDKKGTPCMLDRVENKLYYNQGDGAFSYEEWDYTPVDYVYANGNAYTRTMLYGNSNTKMEMVFDIATQSTQNRGIMGSRGNSANSQLLAIGYGTSVLASDFNNSSYSPYRAAIDYDLNKKYRVYTSKEKRSIIDEATGTVLDENNTLCSNNMSTGALLLGAETGLNYRHVGKIYGAKLWEGATIMRDYIPVVDGDNKGGFYDKCLNIISYSVGTSDFVGHFVENGVDYKVVKNIIASQVATSGNTNACAYIKTGIYPSTSKKTRMKAKAQMAVADSSYDHFLGGTNADSRFVVGQAAASSSSMFYFGLGTQNYWTTQTVDTNLHIFGLDWATETCSVDDTTWQIPSAGTSASSKSFYINARSTTTHDNANRPGGGTSYWWKLWEGKKLVYNGIPVVRASDNKVGLFETVKRQFQTTAGTVEYTYAE